MVVIDFSSCWSARHGTLSNERCRAHRCGEAPASWRRVGQAAGMSEPPLPSAARLRLAVAAFRTGESRRVCPPCLHVGVLGHRGEGVFEATFEEDRHGPLDPDLRREISAALLSRALLFTETPDFWLTRSGHLTTHDGDLAWLAATAAAAGEADLTQTFVVVTRRGWYDPRTLRRREWARLRLV